MSNDRNTPSTGNGSSKGSKSKYQYIKNYLDQVWKHKNQLKFILSTMGFCITLLAIIFGLNAVTIEEFLQPDVNGQNVQNDTYDFLSIQNIAKFPVDQHKLTNGKPRPLNLDSSNAISKIDFLILDVSKSLRIAFEKENYKEKLTSFLTGISSLDKNTLKDKGILTLLVESIYAARQAENVKLYYLVEENKSVSNNEILTEQSLVICSTLERPTPSVNFVSTLDNDIKNYRESRNGNTYFGNLLNEIAGKIKDQTTPGTAISITIISDFKDEGEEVKFNNALTSLKKQRDVEFNLIQMPTIKVKGEDENEVKAKIKDFLGNWDKKTDRLNLRKFEELFSEDKTEKNFWLTRNHMRVKQKEFINLIYPSINNDLSSNYTESSTKRSFPQGKYLISYIDKFQLLGEKIPISITIPDEEPFYFENKKTYQFEGNQFELRSQEVSQFGRLGTLKLVSLGKENEGFNVSSYEYTFSLWQKRRLNKTGIGWYIILLNSFLFSSFILIILFITFFIPDKRIKKWPVLAFILPRILIPALYFSIIFFNNGSLWDSYSLGLVNSHLWVGHISILLLFIAIGIYDHHVVKNTERVLGSESKISG